MEWILRMNRGFFDDMSIWYDESRDGSGRPRISHSRPASQRSIFNTTIFLRSRPWTSRLSTVGSVLRVRISVIAVVGHRLTSLAAGVEVRDREHDAARLHPLQELARPHDGRPGAHHVVEQHDVAALDLVERGIALGVERDLDVALTGALLVEHDELRVGQAEVFVHAGDEVASALVGSAQREAGRSLPAVDHVRLQQIVDIDVVRDQVVEPTLEDLRELVLHRRRVVVNGDDPVDAGEREQLGVEARRERLTVELLAVVDIAFERHRALVEAWTAVLGRVVEVGFDEHDRLGAVVLRGAGDQQVAHREVVAADAAATGGHDDDVLPTRSSPTADRSVSSLMNRGQNSVLANVLRLIRSAMSSACPIVCAMSIANGSSDAFPTSTTSRVSTTRCLAAQRRERQHR